MHTITGEGQINYETNNLGKAIVNLTSLPDVKSIVEIGTWNGLGTTRCVLQGLYDSKKDNYSFISIECNPVMYNQAIVNLSGKINDNINLIHGRIIEEEMLNWFSKAELTSEQMSWLQQDLECFRVVPNVLNRIPSVIDFLILDGGEFSTYPEWCILKDRVRYVALDDTRMLKCTKIREEILASDDYEVIEDDLNGSRYGYMTFKRKL
jgi:hypothetical protein